ncbi:hypothetical protein BDB00DRAFT_828836 [Zychaea mexicana]|uniref:uncharacterized protein n=1 Tax=Zychaea mexicana TaxID=64656 RepID=UPI0022FEC700|nr:uncharacterized protein BDB00DRAFT_828836 [Zychaea mexicana]KAI9492399.1 hypothetical protein BDB00DRAFT_828836 [Zychaea mexicana]
MPQTPDLQNVHQQLMDIAKETQDVSKTQYSAKDVQHLQNKLHHIDEQYREGIVDDRDKSNLEDDPYEHPGQAQIADALSKIHSALSSMLSSVEQQS